MLRAGEACLGVSFAGQSAIMKDKPEALQRCADRQECQRRVWASRNSYARVVGSVVELRLLCCIQCGSRVALWRGKSGASDSRERFIWSIGASRKRVDGLVADGDPEEYPSYCEVRQQ